MTSCKNGGVGMDGGMESGGAEGGEVHAHSKNVEGLLYSRET